MSTIPLSILELAIVKTDGTASSAIQEAVEVAKHVESLGYKRIWLAEHHNMEHIASSATSVMIGHIAGSTRHIRVGAGGIMLPNHSPLVIAEQFGTLATIYPDRIDLGLGRAPGTDQLTASVLRRSTVPGGYNFPSEIRELQTYFSSDNSHAQVRAFPAEGIDVPLWILGSSTDSAYVAAEMGLPYAFAAHFAPAQFHNAIAIYRKKFKPSEVLEKPYVLACVNVIAGETDEEAEFLATSLIKMFIGMITNKRTGLMPPGALPSAYNIPEVYERVNHMLSATFLGSKETLRKNLSAFIEETGIDELMAASYIHDKAARLRSYSILQEALEV